MAAGNRSSGNDTVAVAAQNNSNSGDRRFPCVVCGKPCTTKCSRCKSVFYCSIECQRYDWTTGGHRKACRKLKPKKAARHGPTVGPLPASLRNDRDAGRAIHELWSLAGNDVTEKVTEAGLGERKGRPTPPKSTRKIVEILDDDHNDEPTTQRPTVTVKKTATTTTPASVSAQDSKPNTPKQEKQWQHPKPRVSSKERRPEPPRSSSSNGAESPVSDDSPARWRESLLEQQLSPQLTPQPPQQPSSPSKIAAAVSFIAEEMPQICRFQLSLNLSDEMLRHPRSVLAHESIVVSTEALGRARARTLVTVNLRESHRSSSSSTSILLFEGEFQRPIEASDINWRIVAPPPQSESSETTKVVLRLPYPFDPYNTGSLVLGGSLASSCSPSTGSSLDEINAIVCGSCHLPLLNNANNGVILQRQPKPRPSQPPITRVFPLPQGHWDEIADYLICYDGQPVVDFSAGSVCAEPSIALQDASLLCLHQKVASKAVCVLAVDGYGATPEPPETDGNDRGPQEASGGGGGENENENENATTSINPALSRDLATFLFTKPSETCFVLPSKNEDKKDDDNNKNNGNSGPSPTKSPSDGAAAATSSEEENNTNDNPRNNGEPPILPTSAVIRGDRTWRDATDGTGESVSLCCARCCAPLGFASLGSPETWRFWKHRLSVLPKSSTPILPPTLSFSSLTTTPLATTNPKQPAFVPLPMPKPLGSCSSFLARELVRYAESKAIFTFIVRSEGRNEEEEEDDDDDGAGVVINDNRCLLLRLLSWETAMATSMLEEEDKGVSSAQKPEFRKVAKIVFEETIDPTYRAPATSDPTNGHRGGSSSSTQWFWGGIDLCCPPPKALSDLPTKSSSSAGDDENSTVSTAKLVLPFDDYARVKSDLVRGLSYFEEEVAKMTVLLKMGGGTDREGLGLTAVFLE